MREILFKAKRKDNSEWVEGNLITNEKNENQKYIGYIFDERNGVIEDFDIVEVIPDTICQYTGLTDKNGKRIWENDIVVDEDDCYYEVLWNKNLYNYSFRCFKTEYMFLIGKRWDLYLLANNNRLKVIGNIFDNPNLLEVE